MISVNIGNPIAWKWEVVLKYSTKSYSLLSSINNIFRVRNTAPLRLKVRNNLNNAIATGLISGYGNSNTNNIGEVAGKIILGEGGNILGNYVADRYIGRVGDPLIRNTIGNAISYGAQKGLSYFLK